MQFDRDGSICVEKDVSKLIWAIGRKPFNDIGFDKIGLAMDERGFVKVACFSAALITSKNSVA
jgi:pyruvate/2-oxoglutarate dehydrogenase complex dihydrolipoamide dehydrogenase (E3) component